MDSELITTIDIAKRSCNRCFSQQNFKPSIEERGIALSSTKKLTNLFRDKFDELRKNDESVEDINSAKHAKTLCLDAIDACATCNKSRPKIKEILIELPQ
jgi:hypothetical protein